MKEYQSILHEYINKSFPKSSLRYVQNIKQFNPLKESDKHRLVSRAYVDPLTYGSQSQHTYSLQPTK